MEHRPPTSSIADPLERQLAPAVRGVLVLLLLVAIVGQLARLLRGELPAPTRNANLLVLVAALGALWLLRRGRFRAALGVVTASLIAALDATLLLDGLTQELGSMGILPVPLVLAAFLVGRPMLWGASAALCAGVIGGAWRDVPAIHPDLATAFTPGPGSLLLNVLTGLVLVTILLDRLALALRSAYLREAAKVGELAAAHARLRAVEARFRAAVEGSLDAFLLLEAVRDAEGRVVDFTILECNARMARELGGEPGTLVGRRLRELLPRAGEPGGALERVVAAMEGGVARESTFDPAVALNRWVREQVVPVGDGAAVIVRDLTDQRQAEEREADLRQQFLQAQKMEVVGLLAGTVAHDLNNLLAVIGVSAEQLLREPLGEEERVAMEEASHAVRRAAELTGGLLAFGRRKQPRPQRLDLGELAGRHRSFWQRLCGPGYTVEVRVSPGCGIWADAGEVEQALINVIVNARDAMPGGGRIRLEGGPEARSTPSATALGELPAGRYACLAVSDDGTGIEPAARQRLFEPFFTTKPVGRGTGLGLATVARLLQAQGGGIEVESELGRGSTFRLLWPLAVEPVPETYLRTAGGRGADPSSPAAGSNPCTH